MSDWNPNIRRQLVKGSTAWVLGVHALVAVCTVFVSTVAFGVGMAIRGQGYVGSLPLTILLLLMMASFVHYCVYTVRSGRRLKAEAKAGYTTCRAQAPTLDEVDWKTARVIRLATEPPMKRTELQERIAAVRAAADAEAHPSRPH